MTLSPAKKIASVAILGAAVLAVGASLRGCRNPTEGSVKLAPEARARLKKAPESPWARSVRARAERRGIR
jgi:hypothetical protein